MFHPWLSCESLFSRENEVNRNPHRYLGALPNASEWIREAIDEKLLSDDHPVGLVAITSKIRALRSRRAEIIDGHDYRLSDYSKGFGGFMGEMAKKEGLWLYLGDDEVSVDLDKGSVCLPLGVIDFRAFIDKHEIKSGREGNYFVQGESVEPFLKLVRRNWLYYSELAERHERELRDIEAEIERLQDSIIQGA